MFTQSVNLAPSADAVGSMQNLMSKALISGLSVAHISNGKIDWAASIGVSDKQTNTKLNEDNIFWACSLSKPVFAYLVFKLAKAGVLDKKNEKGEIVDKFDLEKTPLVTIFDDPRFKNDARKEKLTAGMILSHQSGLPNEAKDGIGTGDLEFEFEPGAEFKYSGEGFYYLQKVIEERTSKKLDELAQEFIFGIFGCKNTTFELKKDHLPVKNYDEIGNPKRDFLTLPPNNNNNAAGSLHTTAIDCARILIGMMNDNDFLDFINPRVDMQKDMQAKKQGIDDTILHSISWGLGFGLQRSASNPEKAAFAFHWGDGPGAKGFFVIDVNSKSGFVYFGNSENALGIMQGVAELAKLPNCKPITEFLSKKYHHPNVDAPGFGESMQAQILESEGKYSEAIVLYKKVLESKSNFDVEAINKKINWLIPLTNKFEIPSSKLDNYCGDYGPVKVTKVNDLLQAESPLGKFDLVSIGENLFAPKNDLRFRLEFDNNGKLTSHFYNGKLIEDRKISIAEEYNTDITPQPDIASGHQSSTAFLMGQHNFTPTVQALRSTTYPLGKQNNVLTSNEIAQPSSAASQKKGKSQNLDSIVSAQSEGDHQASDQKSSTAPAKSLFGNLSGTQKITRGHRL